MAGLLSAAAASQAGHAVTVLERDDLETADHVADGGAVALPRRGVPQGHHSHALLHAGLAAMEDLLPGLRQEIRDAGGVPFDTGDLAWLSPQGWSATGRPAYEVLGATRPLVEAVVRRRVCSMPGVRLRSGVTVTGVRSDAAEGRWLVRLANGTDLASDGGLGASRRGSPLGRWLSSLRVGPAGAPVRHPRLRHPRRPDPLPPGPLRPDPRG